MSSNQTNFLLLEKQMEDKNKAIVKDAKKMCVLATLGAPGFFAYSVYKKYKKMFK